MRSVRNVFFFFASVINYHVNVADRVFWQTEIFLINAVSFPTEINGLAAILKAFVVCSNLHSEANQYDVCSSNKAKQGIQIFQLEILTDFSKDVNKTRSFLEMLEAEISNLSKI